MLKITSAAISACTLMACSTSATNTQLNSGLAAPETATNTKIPMADVLGQWDVVSFESHSPARKSGSTRHAFADFEEGGVRLRLECNYSHVSGALRGGRFIAVPRLRAQTVMGCGKEKELRDSRYFSFFDRLPLVERLGTTRLRLTAGNSTLILERPNQRRLAFMPKEEAIQGTWRLEELTRYEPGGGYTGIGLSDISGSIVIRGSQLSYDRCPHYDLSFAYGADGRLMNRGSSPLPEKLDCSSLKDRDYDAPSLPSGMEILPLLHANPWVEDLGNDRLLIANQRLGLTLSRVADRR